MNTLENVFSEDKRQLDRALETIPSEQLHIERCLTLAATINWNSSNANNEFGVMLGQKGILLFDETTQRISALLRNELARELRDYQKFLHDLMFVHDLGKYNSDTNKYDGRDHEERSALIVAGKEKLLLRKLNWTKGNATLFKQLTRFHGLFGITRIGEVSIVFLSPIIEYLIDLNSDKKKLFLDLLVILTCCDAGASGDFTSNTFYLDDSRITLYDQLSRELFHLSEKVMHTPASGVFHSLVAEACEFTNIVTRIKRIVTGNNLLTISERIIEEVLRDLLSKQQLDAKGFALTRFDHGAYVFGPLLAKLERGNTDISRDTLKKFILFLGILCQGQSSLYVVQFRDTFSVKSDLIERNGAKFSALYEAIDSHDPQRISDVLRIYRQGESTYHPASLSSSSQD